MNNSAAHTALVNRICIDLGSLPWLRLEKQATGAGELASGQWVVFGTPGRADIFGICTLPCGVGIFTGIEVKTGSGVLSRDQRAWGAAVSLRGGIYIVAHSVEEARERLLAAREGFERRLRGYAWK